MPIKAANIIARFIAASWLSVPLSMES